MPGSEPDVAWRRHADERWIVGDPGRQHEIVPYPADLAATRPDTTIDGADLGGIEYRAVSLRGFSHWGKREPRQDAYLVRTSANGQWLIGCVADGVSQSKYSHMAADIACREITKHIAAALDDQPAVTASDQWRKVLGELPWQQAVDQANAAMIAKASTGTRDSKDAGPLDVHTVRGAMATTAVGFVVAVTPAEDGQLPFSVLVAAGDSSALVLAGGQWFPITSLKNAGSGDDVPTNAVKALPREVQVAPINGFLRPGDALVVVTDGIGDPMGAGTGEVGQFLAAHWSRPPDLFAFAAHAAFYRRGFTDDRTAVAVWHKPDGPWPDVATETKAAAETAAAGAAPVTEATEAPKATEAAEAAEGTEVAGAATVSGPPGEISDVSPTDQRAGDSGRPRADDMERPDERMAEAPRAGDSLDQVFQWFREEGNGD